MPLKPTDRTPVGPAVPSSMFGRFWSWLRSMLRKRDGGGSGTPPNIYPLY